MRVCYACEGLTRSVVFHEPYSGTLRTRVSVSYGGERWFLFLAHGCKHRAELLAFGLEAIPVAASFFGGGEPAQAEIVTVSARADRPHFGRSDVLRAYPFGRFLLERHAGLNPGPAHGRQEMRIVCLAELIEQDAPSFQSHRLVDDPDLNQVIQEARQEVGFFHNQAAGDFLPGRCVVESVEQARKLAGGL